MKRAAHFFFLLLCAIAVGRASTTESLGGRLEKSAAGEVVLMLDLPVAKLASLADKAGQEADHDVAALADLIHERFHYLLRLRVANRELAPTTVALILPPAGSPLPNFIPLVATWADVGSARGEVVTQSDSPAYRVVLSLVDQRNKTTPTPLLATGMSTSGLWLRPLGRALGTGVVGGIAPGGIAQIFFVLGLYFMARRGRDLVWQILVFTVAYSLTLLLSVGGIVVVPPVGMRWVEAGVALSVVAVALVNFFKTEAPGRAWLGAVAGFGLLHGFALAPAMSGVHGSSLIAACIGIEVRQLIVIGLASLLTGAWRQRLWYCPLYRPGVALPASIVIALGGIVMVMAQMRGVWELSP